MWLDPPLNDTKLVRVRPRQSHFKTPVRQAFPAAVTTRKEIDPEAEARMRRELEEWQLRFRRDPFELER
jgi:hypothetical protein